MVFRRPLSHGRPATQTTNTSGVVASRMHPADAIMWLAVVTVVMCGVVGVALLV
ncbi:hypothetical protein M196_gp56 [Halorubrum tailed virus 4]|uniref:Uncharacterized protein n=1 Tax=Halorubrum tailed virus 4 TaxID=1273752 RepID=R4TLW1_9CAUD|nr:hypothetical protein M196_gp56 [Halorubrum tailed virus 4]AGM11148.1 hypothetical protein HRTV4_56 [Halorubrum tailed virus 4]